MDNLIDNPIHLMKLSKDVNSLDEILFDPKYNNKANLRELVRRILKVAEEMRNNRDYYKKKYEELQAKVDETLGVLTKK